MIGHNHIDTKKTVKFISGYRWNSLVLLVDVQICLKYNVFNIVTVKEHEEYVWTTSMPRLCLPVLLHSWPAVRVLQS